MVRTILNNVSKDSPCSCCVLSFVAVGLIVANAAAGFIYYEVRQKMAASIRVDHDMLVKTRTQTVVSMLDKLYQKAQKGEIAMVQAKKIGCGTCGIMMNSPDIFGPTRAMESILCFYGKDIEDKNRWNSNVGGVYHVGEIVANGKKPGADSSIICIS